jgi:N-acetylglutamate synthase-like GNAT family acetyltransferase
MHMTIRAAEAEDAEPIRALVRAEALGALGLDWRNFMVADLSGRVVGAVQLRHVADGVAELASLAVRPSERGDGLAQRLVDAALAQAPERVLVVAPGGHVTHYRRWGFRRIRAAEAPGAVRVSQAIGQSLALAGMLRGRAPRRLVILERVAMAVSAAA